jgi:copper chaperone NosL
MSRYHDERSRRSAVWGTTLLVVHLAAACSSSPGWPPQPAELHLGEDACAECRMLASDARHAAQLRTPDGEVRFFDDLGCLLAHRRGAAADPLGVFAMTGAENRWVRADRAWVVQSAQYSSPMGYGLMAFGSQAEAQAAAASHPGSSVLPLSDLLREGAAVPGRASAGPADPAIR